MLVRFPWKRCEKGKPVVRRGHKVYVPPKGGSRAAEQGGRTWKNALLLGKEGQGALSANYQPDIQRFVGA
jgi:hypothetical protein